MNFPAFGLKDPTLVKSLWVSIILALATALGLALVTVNGTPLLNFGSLYGVSAALVGSFLAIAIVLLAYDFLRNGKMIYWKDALLGGGVGTIVLSLAFIPLGAVFSFSNIFGLLIGVGVLTVGIWVGIKVGKMF